MRIAHSLAVCVRAAVKVHGVEVGGSKQRRQGAYHREPTLAGTPSLTQSSNELPWRSLSACPPLLILGGQQLR